MKRLAAVLLAVSLAGCTTYQGYGYSDDGYYDDRYYEGPDYYRGSAARDRYYYDDPDYYGYDAFGYGAYPFYYSSLWPIYHGYYDPFYNPYFHYGITYFPSSYFGFGYGGYGYPRYQPYAPYRYSWYDNYFGAVGHHQRRHDRHGDFGGQRSAFGSARNQAERMAAWTGADRIGRDNGRFRGATQPLNDARIRNRSGRGPAVPQRSGPLSPSRGAAPAPRPRSRQYDRGGGHTPAPQANNLPPQSNRERGPGWQSGQRWSAGQSIPPADRGGRGRNSPTATVPAVRPVRDDPGRLSDRGGTSIPSRRSFLPTTAPVMNQGGEVRGAAGLEPRASTGRRPPDQGRRYFSPSPGALPATRDRDPIEARPRTDRAPAANGAYRPVLPPQQTQPDFRRADRAPTAQPQSAPQQRSDRPARGASTARPERSRRDDDGDADDSERRKR